VQYVQYRCSSRKTLDGEARNQQFRLANASLRLYKRRHAPKTFSDPTLIRKKYAPNSERKSRACTECAAHLERRPQRKPKTGLPLYMFLPSRITKANTNLYTLVKPTNCALKYHAKKALPVIKERGAAHICVHLDDDGMSRRSKMSDLIAYYKPPGNVE
jgi:hypothetical protein